MPCSKPHGLDLHTCRGAGAAARLRGARRLGHRRAAALDRTRRDGSHERACSAPARPPHSNPLARDTLRARAARTRATSYPVSRACIGCLLASRRMPRRVVYLHGLHCCKWTNAAEIHVTIQVHTFVHTCSCARTHARHLAPLADHSVCLPRTQLNPLAIWRAASCRQSGIERSQFRRFRVAGAAARSACEHRSGARGWRWATAHAGDARSPRAEAAKPRTTPVLASLLLVAVLAISIPFFSCGRRSSLSPSST
eukprot:6179187-Pleurochrysis_carterae.AAC.2